MRTVGSIAAVAAVLAAVACGQSKQAQAPAMGRTEAQAKVTCPTAELRNVHAKVIDTKEGADVRFIGSSDDASAIRADVEKLVKANDDLGDAFASCGCGIGAQYGATSMQGAPAKPIAASAKEKDETHGARLQLAAKNGDDVKALREQVHASVRALEKGCLSHKR